MSFSSEEGLGHDALLELEGNNPNEEANQISAVDHINDFNPQQQQPKYARSDHQSKINKPQTGSNIGPGNINSSNKPHQNNNNDHHHHNYESPMNESAFSELPTETNHGVSYKGKKGGKNSNMPPPPPPPPPSSSNAQQQQQQLQRRDSQSKDTPTKGKGGKQQQQQQQQQKSEEPKPFQPTPELPQQPTQPLPLSPQFPTTPPPSLKTTTLQQPQPQGEVVVPTGGVILLDNETHQPLSPQVSSYQRLHQTSNPSTTHSHPSSSTSHHPAQSTSSSSQKLNFSAQPQMGCVDQPFRHRATQPITPSPPPPNRFVTDLPIVHRNDLSFHVEDPFPVQTQDKLKQLVYYFPIIITASYVNKMKSPLALTLSPAPNQQQLSASLSSSSASFAPVNSIQYPTSVLQQFTNDPHFKPQTYLPTPREAYHTFSWTVHIRFSQFDHVYQRLAQLYPTLSPQLSKIPDPSPDVRSIKRRPMLQDLIHALYDIPFVSYTPEFQQLFLIPDYIILYPFYPHVPQISYDLYGQCFKHYMTKELNGLTRRDQQKLNESTLVFSNKSSYGLNHSYCLPDDNVLFTPVQYNDLLSKKLSQWSSYFVTNPLSAQCEIKNAYGGVIAWVYHENVARWVINSILPLDTNVDECTVQAVEGGKYALYLGCANGQLIKATWSSSERFQFSSCIKAHDKQICGLYAVNGMGSGALISVSREGTILFRPDFNGGQPIYMNVEESLLSTAFVNNRYLVLGADSGYIIIIDAFSPSQDYFDQQQQIQSSPTNHNMVNTNQSYFGGAGQQSAQPIVHDFFSLKKFNPKMVYYAQHHNHGIRYIATVTTNNDNDNTSNSRNGFFQSQRYDALLPYNQLRDSFDLPYTMQYTNNKTIIHQPPITSEQHTDGSTTSLINASVYTKTHWVALGAEIGNNTNNHSANNHHPPQQQFVPTANPSSSQPHSVTYILTCSHDGSNKIFAFNEIIHEAHNNNSTSPQNQLASPLQPQGTLQSQALLPIETLKAHPSHCAAWCVGTPYFITAHDESSQCRLVIWDSNALKKGPILVFNTETTQITTMIWLPETYELLTTSRDGVVKVWSFQQIFHDNASTGCLFKPYM